jgi:hypothetical protein
MPTVNFGNQIPDAAVAIGLGANADPADSAPPPPSNSPKDLSSMVDQFIADKLGKITPYLLLSLFHAP